MHDSKVIANRFLDLAQGAGRTLTPMQILKLVYIAHGWMLGLYGRALINDEVQAWQYGPVIPRLYNVMRRFRSSPVEGPIPVSVPETLTPNEDALVEQVFSKYGHLSGPALSRITHMENSPWSQTYISGEFGTPIPNDLIQDHYQRLSAETA